MTLTEDKTSVYERGCHLAVGEGTSGWHVTESPTLWATPGVLRGYEGDPYESH